jgi:hypothetical protein
MRRPRLTGCVVDRVVRQEDAVMIVKFDATAYEPRLDSRSTVVYTPGRKPGTETGTRLVLTHSWGRKPGRDWY